MGLLSNKTRLAALLCASLAPAVYFLWRSRKARSKRTRLPPGPKGYPIIGNYYDLPAEGSHLQYSEWKKSYGDLIFLSVLGRNILVCNSRETVMDILHKRGANSSDRPRMPILERWCGLGWAIFTWKYEGEIHDRRRMVFQSINKNTMPHYEQHMHKEALDLARRILATPERFLFLIDRMTGTTIMRIAYGHAVYAEHDQWIGLANNMNHSFREASKALGTHIAEVLPFLTLFPAWIFGLKEAKAFKTCYDSMNDMVNLPYNMVKKQVERQEAAPSMTRWLIEQNMNPDGSIANEHMIKEITAESFAAGADVTEAMIKVFILAMLALSEKSWTGCDGIEPVTSRPKVAIYRWLATQGISIGHDTPALPHQLTNDEEYNGYFIPAGTMVVPNSYECARDESIFPEPEEFRPERFTDGVKLFTNIVEPRDFAFGYGRRVCPGRQISDSTLWITIVTMLYVFDIRKAIGPDGQPIEPDLVLANSTATSFPKPFVCDFIPRSAQHIEILNTTYESVLPSATTKPSPDTV
ncbi:Cytochrome P450 [Mycena venus]|uniref:Cytochrome P450 n=1 Tax=Mycena venus TaxID=2733690 RepID=A0A8H6XVP7_9AGAR|nr:Cytochrome P450 [Mycena venus]